VVRTIFGDAKKPRWGLEKRRGGFYCGLLWFYTMVMIIIIRIDMWRERGPIWKYTRVKG
jgi:hypothetical protein